jgi:hypothetical protein
MLNSLRHGLACLDREDKSIIMPCGEAADVLKAAVPP